MGCLQRGLWPPAALTGGGALTPQAGPPVWPRLACVGLEARKAKQQAASACVTPKEKRGVLSH